MCKEEIEQLKTQERTKQSVKMVREGRGEDSVRKIIIKSYGWLMAGNMESFNKQRQTLIRSLEKYLFFRIFFFLFYSVFCFNFLIQFFNFKDKNLFFHFFFFWVQTRFSSYFKLSPACLWQHNKIVCKIKKKRKLFDSRKEK